MYKLVRLVFPGFLIASCRLKRGGVIDIYHQSCDFPWEWHQDSVRWCKPHCRWRWGTDVEMEVSSYNMLEPTRLQFQSPQLLWPIRNCSMGEENISYVFFQPLVSISRLLFAEWTCQSKGVLELGSFGRFSLGDFNHMCILTLWLVFLLYPMNISRLRVAFLDC